MISFHSEVPFEIVDADAKATWLSASWHDFYIGVFLRSMLKLQANFVGKKILFNPLTGWFFRALGGAPVHRNANEKQVDAIARLFENRTEFRMLLAPEGTRKTVTQWKTGFNCKNSKCSHNHVVF